MACVAETQRGAVERLALIFLDLGDEVLQVGDAQSIQRRVCARVVALRLRDEALKIRGDDKPGTVAINIGYSRAE